MIYDTSAIIAMRPSARETKGGNWQPVIVHTDRVWYRNEHFPHRLKRTRSEALACAENIILGRAAAIPKRHEITCITRLGFDMLHTEGVDCAAKVTAHEWIPGTSRVRIENELLIPRFPPAWG